MTSDRASSDFSVWSERPEPGTGTRVLPASGTRTASPWPPSISPSPKLPPRTQLSVAPLRQCGQDMSLKMNGAITKSPAATPSTSAPVSSTTPMNSWPIEPTGMRGLAPPVPQVGPAHAGQHHPDDRVGRLFDDRIGAVGDLDRAWPVE